MEFIKFGSLTKRELDIVLAEKQTYKDKVYLSGIYNSQNGSHYNKDVRGGFIYFLKAEESKKTVNILQSIIIQQYSDIDFDFDLSNISSVQFAKYETGDKFVWHQDVIGNREPVRAFTMSVNLSSEEQYTGGEFLLKHNNETLCLNKEQGSFIIFPSFLEHQASEVLSGTRESMVVWIQVTNKNLETLKQKYVEKYGKY